MKSSSSSLANAALKSIFCGCLMGYSGNSGDPPVSGLIIDEIGEIGGSYFSFVVMISWLMNNSVVLGLQLKFKAEGMSKNPC